MNAHRRPIVVLYRAVLGLAPAEFRRRWREAILETLIEREKEEGASFGFWMGEMSDLVRTVMREWMRAATAPKEPARTLPRRGRVFDVGQDVRYALRSLGRQPSFTAVALLTLAIGIGANSAMFTIVHAVVVESLPFPEPERLVFAHGSSPQFDRAAVSPSGLPRLPRASELVRHARGGPARRLFDCGR